MKLVVSSTGGSLDSPVDPRFGRAAWFVLVDTESGEHWAVENIQGQKAGHGAGIMAAQTVSNLKAEVLLTGECGPKAFDALKAAGIKVRTGAAGTVVQAVEAFKASGAG